MRPVAVGADQQTAGELGGLVDHPAGHRQGVAGGVPRQAVDVGLDLVPADHQIRHAVVPQGLDVAPLETLLQRVLEPVLRQHQDERILAVELAEAQLATALGALVEGDGVDLVAVGDEVLGETELVEQFEGGGVEGQGVAAAGGAPLGVEDANVDAPLGERHGGEQTHRAGAGHQHVGLLLSEHGLLPQGPNVHDRRPLAAHAPAHGLEAAGRPAGHLPAPVSPGSSTRPYAFRRRFSDTRGDRLRHYPTG